MAKDKMVKDEMGFCSKCGAEASDVRTEFDVHEKIEEYPGNGFFKRLMECDSDKCGMSWWEHYKLTYEGKSNHKLSSK